jgi:hypothetical protein
MLQIDVFIAYGVGGALSVAGSRGLRDQPHALASREALAMGAMSALVGVPGGIWMISRHAPWETMQVFPQLGSIPPWLLLAFVVTMTTQAALGFWITDKLMKRGSIYLANLHWMAGFFIAAFIVMYGWDGLAWDRFLYDPEAAGGAPWQPGAGRELGVRWLFSPAARSLLFVSVALLVPVLYAMGSWAIEGAGRDPSLTQDQIPSRGSVALGFLKLFGIALLTAAGSSVTVYAVNRVIAHHVLSYLVGVPLSLLLASLAFRPGGIVHRTAHRFAGSEDASRA